MMWAKAGLEDRLDRGKYTHQELASDIPWLEQTKIGRIDPSEWELIYSDPHDKTSGEPFIASRLKVGGEVMRGRPDAVFRKKTSGVVLILERKTTGRRYGSIPTNAWPNIRAQLWCYAWMDDWFEAPTVYLVCQFLKRRAENIDPKYPGQKYYGRKRQNRSYPWIADFISRPSWTRSDVDLNKEMLQFFYEYGGTAEIGFSI